MALRSRSFGPHKADSALAEDRDDAVVMLRVRGQAQDLAPADPWHRVERDRDPAAV